MSDIINAKREKFVQKLLPTKKLKIYTKEQIKNVIERWTREEYSIRRVGSSFKTYKQCINQEVEADKEYQEIVKDITIPDTLKQIVLLYKVRCCELYLRACRRYPLKVEYWKEYLNYLIDNKLFHAVSSGFTEALQFHSRDVSVWKMLSDFYINNDQDIDNGRKVIMLALEINNEEPEGWLVYLKFELAYKHKIIKRTDITLPDDEEMKKTIEQLNKIPVVIYNNSVKIIKDVSFKLRFLLTLKEETDLNELKETINNDIVSDFTAMQTDKEKEENLIKMSEFDKEMTLEIVNSASFNDLLNGELKTSIVDKINGKMEIIETPLDISLKKIQESQGQDVQLLISTMKQEMLNINRSYLFELKSHCFDEITSIEGDDKIIISFIEWLLKTECNSELYIKMAKWYDGKDNWTAAKKCLDEGIIHTSIAKNDISLLFCQ